MLRTPNWWGLLEQRRDHDGGMGSVKPDGMGSVKPDVVAAVLFSFAVVAYFATQPGSSASAARPLPLFMLTLLAGGYLALGVDGVGNWLRAELRRRPIRTIAGPVVLWAAAVGYAALAGLAVRDIALAYALYLALPTILFLAADRTRRTARLLEVTAVLILAVAIKYHVLPSLPVPAPSGYDASRLVGLVAGLYLFVVARPLPGIGYTWDLGPRDLGIGALAFAAFAVIALPIGFATGLLVWHPQPSWANALVKPVVIYLITAVPEEFVFRGVLQNVLVRWLGVGLGLAVAAVIFGLSHYPDPRYMLLATFAGVAYGWAYLRTGKITAAAVTHALVDAVWVILLR